MAENKLKKTLEPEIVETQSTVVKKKSSGGMFSFFDKYISLGNSFNDGVPVQYLPIILYVAFFLLLYIANSHNGDRLIRKINKLKIEVNDLRADYTTLKAELMLKSKQSEVAKQIEPYGLKESIEPPTIIKVKESEY